MKISNLKIIFFIFSQKSFFYISGNGTFLDLLNAKKKFFVIFLKMELSCIFLKKVSYYILVNETFQP